MSAEAWPSFAAPADRGRICVVHAPGGSAGTDALTAALRTERYEIVLVGADRTVIARIAATQPDLVVVVAGADRLDVVRLCESLHDDVDCRVLVVVEPGRAIGETTVIELLDSGADDFVDGETGTPVLLARIRVAMRASPLRRRRPQEIVIGDVLIDLDAHAVLVGGEVVNCPPRQFDILVALASNVGTMILRDALIADVWGIPPGTVDPRRVRIAISLLRGLIGKGPQRPVIESVSRLGYRLAVPGGVTRVG